MNTPAPTPDLVTFALATLAAQAAPAAVITALDDARQPNGDCQSAAAVDGCLRALARLDLTVLEAHVLLAHTVAPQRTIAATAKDIQQPEDSVLRAIGSLFKRGLIKTPFGGQLHLTDHGAMQTAVIIGCTAAAQAAHLLRRTQKPAAIPA